MPVNMLAIGHVKLFLIMFLLPSINSTCENVTMQLQSNPARFGQMVNLSCSMSTNESTCNTLFPQWYGGKEYGVLCQNEICRDQSKYNAIKEAPCSYTLMILKFSEYDVDCEYACMYGINFCRRNITSDSNNFQYLPATTEILTNLTWNFNVISMNITFTKIFPLPTCNMTYGKENISYLREDFKKTSSIFNEVFITMKHELENCDYGALNVYCSIGDNVVLEKHTEHGHCFTDMIGGWKTEYIIIIFVFVIIIICILIVCCLKVDECKIIMAMIFHFRRHEKTGIKEKTNVHVYKQNRSGGQKGNRFKTMGINFQNINGPDAEIYRSGSGSTISIISSSRSSLNSTISLNDISLNNNTLQ